MTADFDTITITRPALGGAHFFVSYMLTGADEPSRHTVATHLLARSLADTLGTALMQEVRDLTGEAING